MWNYKQITNILRILIGVKTRHVSDKTSSKCVKLLSTLKYIVENKHCKQTELIF